jgi:putative zinc finger/helix-turn-helix YgiT family protein
MTRINHSLAGRSALSCPACDNQVVREQWTDESFEYGVEERSTTLRVRVPLCHCENCGLEFTDHRAEELRHAAVCRHLMLLTPAEIIAIRERNGMSQQAFAELSRIGRASLARWESGSIVQNASVDSFLYLLCFSENIERLRQRFTEPDASDNADQARCTEPKARFRSLSTESINRCRSQAANFQLHLNA